MVKRWAKKDITYLKRYGKSKKLEELAKRFDTDVKTVQAKLFELGVVKKAVRDRVWTDPLIKDYEQGLKALERKDWSRAAERFEKVASESDEIYLVGRARQYLEVCGRLQEKGDTGGTDAYLEAVLHKNRGELEEALEICKSGGRHKKDVRFAYLAASIHALEERLDEAAEMLGLAIEMNPEDRVHAFHDSDFAALRAEQEYRYLFGLD